MTAEVQPIIYTASTGYNSDLIPNIFALYVPERSVIADVTYGRGVFWRNIDKSQYTVLESDLMTGIDFRALPYGDSTVDVLVLDPPYMHGGQTIDKRLNSRYRNDNGSHESVIRLYTGGILEAARVLRKNGRIIVKTQDEVVSSAQRMSHVEIITILELLGFRIEDMFVLVQKTTAIMGDYRQKTARKNHSYAIVATFKR